MRKESSTLQKCKRQMATLGFDSQLAYHRVKADFENLPGCDVGPQ